MDQCPVKMRKRGPAIEMIVEVQPWNSVQLNALRRFVECEFVKNNNKNTWHSLRYSERAIRYFCGYVQDADRRAALVLSFMSDVERRAATQKRGEIRAQAGFRKGRTIDKTTGQERERKKAPGQGRPAFPPEVWEQHLLQRSKQKMDWKHANSEKQRQYVRDCRARKKAALRDNCGTNLSAE